MVRVKVRVEVKVRVGVKVRVRVWNFGNGCLFSFHHSFHFHLHLPHAPARSIDPGKPWLGSLAVFNSLGSELEILVYGCHAGGQKLWDGRNPHCFLKLGFNYLAEDILLYLVQKILVF